MEAPFPILNTSSIFGQVFDGISAYYPQAVTLIKNVMGVLIGISFVISIFLFIVIIYCVERLKIIRNKESEKFDAKTETAYEEIKEKGDMILAKRWDSIKKHMESDNQNDWKQAIMDADIILDDLLNKMGYRGESIGEKLKRVEKGDFASLDAAWEAHKVRNQIAHEGASFSLNHHTAKQAFNNYRKVFEEFYYI